ncbi:MAG: transglutaminaseTgpA domain-containing protein [Propionibacteriaceae bacterium]|nr:transglutaminaseTgpA domain-containing protein [Propionibacteriaceae bacterium]
MRRIGTGLAVFVAMLTPIATLGLVTADPAWWTSVWALIGALAATSIGIRLLRGGDGLARIAQLAVLLAWLGVLALSWEPGDGAAPGALERLSLLMNEGARHLQLSQAPMPPSPAALWVLLAFAGWLYIIAELVVTTLEQPGWSITVLSVPLLVTIMGPGLSLPWWTVVGVVLGYAVILYAATAARPAAHTQLAAGGARRTQASGWVASAVLVSALALVTAAPLTAVLPTAQWVSLPRFTGAQPLELRDPSIDLSASLNRPDNPVLLTYTTEAPLGVRLRLTALSVLDATGARLDTIKISSGRMPAPPGASGATPVTTSVQVGQFSAEYLPTPYAPVRHDAPGKWGWDAATRSILATGQNRTTATSGLSYEVSSLLTEPSPAAVASATAGRPPIADRTAEIPADLPESVRQLAQQVTADATADGEKAMAIQRFLRDPDQFRYTTAAPGGSGYEVLERFLFEDRSGYCIHFAAAMTAMSRVVGIPSRIAVGFLPGTQRPDGSWAVTAHDMHAWPELYFEGLGWVAFEPTAAVSSRPGTGETPPPGGDPSPTPQPQGQPTGGTSASPAPQPTAGPSQIPVPAPGAPAGGPGIAWLALPLIPAALLAPAGARALLRRRRLAAAAAGDAEAAWREVHATWLDAGHAWPAQSPRRTGALLAAALPEASAAATSLARLVERSRYARSAQADPAAASLAGTLNSAIRAACPAWRKATGILLPRSLWQLGRTTLDVRSPDTSQGGTDGPL